MSKHHYSISLSGTISWHIQHDRPSLPRPLFNMAYQSNSRSRDQPSRYVRTADSS
ncbi:hypothetical protein AGABI1DRAFT_134658 [Agaricus bisporus var. burnettii JB137-S8]|uniref:Uncharacterized protein n=1 Tax=Agaricus bisporus var. burnettii (strain JB137-S8 / ATCC MYA-4627 / FGSC 10392) TaxID=597362 RepID=K5WRX3_AGABU|nr:uncharacterized protein AGABI1DRAFT_134658 [Agaricus bisporus var. burnettii JB137-S8]EKM73498.1 hypothetical protein AGABI1DRAFT_134658 [Agaricus bisporus var. burnettii JB137-S8]